MDAEQKVVSMAKSLNQNELAGRRIPRLRDCMAALSARGPLEIAELCVILHKGLLSAGRRSDSHLVQTIFQ